MIKQVIVFRRLYPDENGFLKKVRTGKMIAQCCHASSMFLVNKIQSNSKLSKEEKEWIDNGFTKISVYVDTEEELLDIMKQANANEIKNYLITDSGKTEFNNIPTITCLSLGPDLSEKIDLITKHLPLL